MTFWNSGVLNDFHLLQSHDSQTVHYLDYLERMEEGFVSESQAIQIDLQVDSCADDCHETGAATLLTFACMSMQ